LESLTQRVLTFFELLDFLLQVVADALENWELVTVDLSH